METSISQKLPYIDKSIYACMRWFFMQFEKTFFLKIAMETVILLHLQVTWRM